MKSVALVLVGMAAALSGTGPVGAMVADIPLPVLVQQADLIAVVKVTQAGQAFAGDAFQPAEFNYGGGLPVPADQAQPRAGHWRTFSVTIEKIHRDATGKLKAGEAIKATAPAAPPPQPGPPLFVADGPFYPMLQAGQSYLLILRSLGEGKGYYLPGYFKCVTPAGQIDARLGAGAADLLDIEKWGWGPPDPGGLQIAVLVHQPIIALAGRNTRTGQRVTSLQVMIALRNTSDKKLTLTADGALRPLGLELESADGKKLPDQPELYANLAQPDPRSKPPVEVAPRQVVFLTPYGPGGFYCHMQTALPAGKFKATATYAVDKDKLPKAPNADGAAPKPGEGDADKPAPSFWTGTVRSGPKAFEVQPNPAIQPPPRTS